MLLRSVIQGTVQYTHCILNVQYKAFVKPPVVTIYAASLTFNNSTFCPHNVFTCFVWIWKQTAIISLYNINWLVCITERECVYCAVRTASSYLIRVKSAKYLVGTPIHGACHASHAARPILVSKFLPTRIPPNLIFNADGRLVSSAAYSNNPLPRVTFLTSQKLYLASSLPLIDGRGGTAWEPSE